MKVLVVVVVGRRVLHTCLCNCGAALANASSRLSCLSALTASELASACIANKACNAATHDPTRCVVVTLHVEVAGRACLCIRREEEAS